MSAINANIVVEPITLNVTESSINQTVTVDPINLSVYTSAPQNTLPGGSDTELQFNNANSFGGLANSSVSSGTLTFSNLANLKILGGTSGYSLTTDGAGVLSWSDANVSNTANVANNLNATSTANVVIGGGVNGYVLQTDGAGVLSWTAQTGGGGVGTPGGANTQIQYNDSGVFGGFAGFTFNEVTGNVDMPANLSLVGAISATNIGNVAPLNLDGNSANVLRGDGSFAPVGSGTNWNAVANISAGDIFMGKQSGGAPKIAPGGNLVVTGTSPTTFTDVTTNATTNFEYLGWENLTGNFWSTNGASQLKTSSDGATWVNIGPSDIHEAPVAGTTQLVAYERNTTNAYTSPDGSTWTTRTLPTIGTFAERWADLAYGDGNFVLVATFGGKAAYSTDEGNTWTLGGFITVSNPPWATIAAKGGGSNEFVAMTSNGDTAISTDGGVTWTAGSTVPGVTSFPFVDLTHANGYYVVAHPKGISYRSDAISTWTTVTFPQTPAVTNYNALIWADPYWIAFDNASFDTHYTTDPTGTWTKGTTNGTAATIGTVGAAYNELTDTVLASQKNTTTISRSISPKVEVTDSDGDYANATFAPNGTYRSLGAASGNVGGLWTRLV